MPLPVLNSLAYRDVQDGTQIQSFCTDLRHIDFLAVDLTKT